MFDNKLFEKHNNKPKTLVSSRNIKKQLTKEKVNKIPSNYKNSTIKKAKTFP